MVMFMGIDVGDLSKVERFHKQVVGAELNVAIGLTRLGIETTYLCRLGNDSFGSTVVNYLKTHGIDSRITFGDEYTGFQFKTKTSDFDSEVKYYRKDSAASYLSIKDFKNIDFSTYDWVHITGIPVALFKNISEIIDYIKDQCDKFSIPISFDPNIREDLWENPNQVIENINRLAFRSDYFMPGVGEAQQLTGLQNEDEILKFYITNGTKNIFLKKGSEGASYSNGTIYKNSDGMKMGDTVDTVGAGDGFAVGVIYSLLNNRSIETCLLSGNLIGALQVTYEGDNEGLPVKNKLEELIKENL